MVDILGIDRGCITAPAGCGKTHLIADALQQYSGRKKILILTHTNAGVAALRSRLDKFGVSKNKYSLVTIDGWAMRIAGQFPLRSEVDADTLKLTNPSRHYPAIRMAAYKLLKNGHIQDLLAATYERLIVDEYQDCTLPQHAIAAYASTALPTCVLGDPMQGIFGWQGNELADWDAHVCNHFPIVEELNTPWRWINAGTQELGEWLLDARKRLQDGNALDLANAPQDVEWVHLNGDDDRAKQLLAAQTKAPTQTGSVLIIGDSRSPDSQRAFASQIPGAITVEAVDLKDLVAFARGFEFEADNALDQLVEFGSKVMTGIGAADLLRRVDIIVGGRQRKSPSDVEASAVRFVQNPIPETAVELLVEMNKEGGTRVFRPAVLRACLRALESCFGTSGDGFHESVLNAREQNRLLGRPLPKRAVGSTLLLKGLEADVSVILDAAQLDAKHTYVALTRGARKIVVCSASRYIGGAI